MRSTILFDLDDTLIDRKESIRNYTDRFVKDFASELGSNNPASLVGIVIDCDQGGYRSRAEVSDRLAHALPWRIPPPAETLLAHWMEHFPSDSAIRTHALDVLQVIRKHGLTIGMVTNGSTIGQNRKIDYLGIRSYFSSIIISESAGIKKPAAAIFELALKELKKQPHDCWFVGDSPRNDILGSADLGLTPIWLRGPHPWPEAHPQPKYQIDGLDEIPAILERDSS